VGAGRIPIRGSSNTNEHKHENPGPGRDEVGGLNSSGRNEAGEKVVDEKNVF